MNHGAFCIVIYKDKFLLMLRDNIPTLKSANMWSLLGGGMEEGETFEQTMLREVKEEANIELKEYKLVGYITTDEAKSALYVSWISEDQYLKMDLGDEGQTLGLFRIDKLSMAQMGVKMNKLVENCLPGLEKLLKREEIKPEELGLSAN